MSGLDREIAWWAKKVVSVTKEQVVRSLNLLFFTSYPLLLTVTDHDLPRVGAGIDGNFSVICHLVTDVKEYVG